MHQRGFSLIELITILVLIGALATFVVPKLDPTGFNRYAFRQEVLAALRYAQKTAMAAGCEVKVDFHAGAESYDVLIKAVPLGSGGTPTSCGNGGFIALNDPVDGGAYTGMASAGVDLQANGAVVFNGLGVPTGGGAEIEFAAMPDIIINPVTGYVQG